MINHLRVVLTTAFLSMTALQLNAGVIQNGGFETGDLTGWTLTGGEYAFVDTASPHSGNYHFRGYDNSGFGILAQTTFATTAGTTYDLSFFSKASHVTAGNILRYQIDTNPIVNVTTTTSYAETTGTFIAGAGSTTLSFFFETDPGTGIWYIDDVDAVSTVPEPTSLAIFGIGTLGTVVIRRRRKRKTT